jgi:HAD superfamily hydrolase (TIGR01662 family)
MTMRAINKALFLDLDGTIIVTRSGARFPKDKMDYKFNQNILYAIEQYVNQGFHVMIVSNQGGIEKGIVKLNDFREKIRRIVNVIIVETGIPMAHIGYRYAIGNSEDDYFRKPNPGMAYDLAMSYILDLSESIMVGDASGKFRETKELFIGVGEDMKEKWAYIDGTPVPDEVFEQRSNKLEVTGRFTAKLHIHDFADSDKVFAEKAGMKYVDVNDFLNQFIQDETSTSIGHGTGKSHVPSPDLQGNR